MGHHQTGVNSISPRVLEVGVIEIQKQPIKIKVTQSLTVIIPTIGVEIVVVPNINFVKSGVLIGFTMNLGHGLGGVPSKMNLTRSLKTPLGTIGVLGTP